MFPEKEPERHVPYSPLPGGPEAVPGPKSWVREFLVPLALAGALAAALGVGYLLTRTPAPAPEVAPPITAPAVPMPREERGTDSLTAPQPALPPAPVPDEAVPAKPAAGACRAYITVTNNSFQPYKYIDRCPIGQHAERTDWPKAGDCGCFSGKDAPRGAAGRMGQ